MLNQGPVHVCAPDEQQVKGAGGRGEGAGSMRDVMMSLRLLQLMMVEVMMEV
jgi:hypothetical protein